MWWSWRLDWPAGSPWSCEFFNGIRKPSIVECPRVERGQSPRELVANLFAETKKTVLTDFDISQLFGAGFDYMYLPVIRTRGNSGCMARRELVGYQHFDAPVLLLRPCFGQLLVALNGGYCRFMALHNSLQSCTS
jgi:hypothetical protein